MFNYCLEDSMGNSANLNKKIRNPETFSKITYEEFYELYFGKSIHDNPMSLKQIAKLYGVDKKVVKAKKKELHINFLNCAIMFVAGGSKYRSKAK